MSLIGVFNQQENGYSGRIQTIVLDAAIKILPAKEKTSKQSPDYRVNLVDGEKMIAIGSGWLRRADNGRAYVALLIDDPSFDQPIKANLMLADEKLAIHHLYWSRKTDAHTAAA